MPSGGFPGHTTHCNESQIHVVHHGVLDLCMIQNAARTQKHHRLATRIEGKEPAEGAIQIPSEVPGTGYVVSLQTALQQHWHTEPPLRVRSSSKGH